MTVTACDAAFFLSDKRSTGSKFIVYICVFFRTCIYNKESIYTVRLRAEICAKKISRS